MGERMPVYLFLRTVYLKNRVGAAFFLKMASFETQHQSSKNCLLEAMSVTMKPPDESNTNFATEPKRRALSQPRSRQRSFSVYRFSCRLHRLSRNPDPAFTHLYS